MKPSKELRVIRRWMIFFILALLVSGATAIPIDTELSLLLHLFPAQTKMHTWLDLVLTAYRDTRATYPYLLYGYDWLAFAHFMLAVLFIGPYKDPVRNIWVIEFGMIACVCVLPLAFIAGHFRSIPFGWQLIDCSFGVAGFVPLWICHTLAVRIDAGNKPILQHQPDRYAEQLAKE